MFVTIISTIIFYSYEKCVSQWNFASGAVVGHNIHFLQKINNLEVIEKDLFDTGS